MVNPKGLKSDGYSSGGTFGQLKELRLVCWVIFQSNGCQVNTTSDLDGESVICE